MKQILAKNLVIVEEALITLIDEKETELKQLIEDTKSELIHSIGYTGDDSLKVRVSSYGKIREHINSSLFQYTIGLSAIEKNNEGKYLREWEIISFGRDYQGLCKVNHSSNSYNLAVQFDRYCLHLIHSTSQFVLNESLFQIFEKKLLSELGKIQEKYYDKEKELYKDQRELNNAIKKIEQEEAQEKEILMLSNRKRVDTKPDYTVNKVYNEDESILIGASLKEINNSLSIKVGYNDSIRIHGYQIVSESTSGKTFEIKVFVKYQNGTEYSTEYKKVSRVNVIDMINTFQKWNVMESEEKRIATQTQVDAINESVKH